MTEKEQEVLRLVTNYVLNIPKKDRASYCKLMDCVYLGKDRVVLKEDYDAVISHYEAEKYKDDIE